MEIKLTPGLEGQAQEPATQENTAKNMAVAA